MCPLSKKIVLPSEYFYACVNNLLFILSGKFITLSGKTSSGKSDEIFCK